MKRMHIHISVNELSASIRFYSTIFGASPSIVREDYAKWELSDPAVNFAISNRGHTSGINHLGIQVDSDNELKEISKRLDEAEIASLNQEGAACCYVRSNKYWATDPQGIAWESFHTLDEIPIFGDDSFVGSADESSTCCDPIDKIPSDDGDAAACCDAGKGNFGGCCS